MKSVIAFLLCILCLPARSQTDSLSFDRLLDSIETFIEALDFEKAENLVNNTLRKYEKPDLSKDDNYFKIAGYTSAILFEKGLFQQAKVSLDEVILDYNKTGKTALNTEIDLRLQGCNILVRLGKYEEALHESEEIIKLEKSRDKHDDKRRIRCLISNAIPNFYLYNTEKSISLYEEALEAAQCIVPDDNVLIESLYSNLAIAYSNLSQNEKALNYLENCLSLRIRKYGPDFHRLENTYYNIGHVLEEQQKYKEAITNYNENLRILALYYPGHEFAAETHRRIAQCTQALGDFSVAFEHLKKAEEIYLALDRKNPNLAHVYKAFAELCEQKEDYPQAILYADSAIILTKEIARQHPWLAVHLGKKARYYLEMGQVEEALKNSLKSLDVLNYDSTVFQDPQKLNDLPDKGHFMSTLYECGSVYLDAYMLSQNTQYLHEAINYLEHSIKVIEAIRLDLAEESSKLELNQPASEIYAKCLEACYHLWKIEGRSDFKERAFQLSELRRHSTVLEAIRSRQKNIFPEIPEEHLLRERNLQDQITVLEQKLAGQNDTSRINSPSSDNKLLGDELFQVKLRWYRYLDTLAEKYPEYYEFRYKKRPINIDLLQKSLAPDEILIEFFDTEDFIYIFTLSRDSLLLNRITSDRKLLAAIDRHHLHLTNPDTILSDFQSSLKQLHSASASIYTSLLEPVFKFNQNIRDITIIPDAREMRILVDILPDAGEKIDDYNYLFNKYDIHYAQNLKVLDAQKSLSPEANNYFVGFAPDYQETDPFSIDTFDQQVLATLVRSGLFRLPGARKEMLDIRSITRGQAYLDKEATERNFVTNATSSKIIHISAHAILDHDFPAMSKFIFSRSRDSLYDGDLTAAEICNLNLSADLAVLSACHTGSGKINRGEGVLSLGRAFAFAGVPSTLISLWKVPDETTARLMPEFYEALGKGITKQAALDRARNQYLAKTKIQEQKHPYFWAGFVLYGDNKAVHHNRIEREKWLFILIPSAFILIFLTYLSKGKNPS